MSQPEGEPTTSATFVMRFWREWSAAEPRWRGRIEHVQSGQQAGFLEIGGMLRFLEHFGIGGEAFHKGIADTLGDDAGGGSN